MSNENAQPSRQQDAWHGMAGGVAVSVEDPSPRRRWKPGKGFLGGMVSGAITSTILGAGGMFGLGTLAALLGGPAVLLAAIGAAVGGVMGAAISYLNAETNEKGNDGRAAFRAGIAVTLAGTALAATGLIGPSEPSATPAQEFNYRCAPGQSVQVAKSGNAYTVNVPAGCRAL